MIYKTNACSSSVSFFVSDKEFKIKKALFYLKFGLVIAGKEEGKS